MKIKKRYYVACVFFCLIALALSVGMFYFEMGLARYSKMNKVVKENWIETSESDPAYNNMNTTLFVTKVYKEGESSAKGFDYIGKQTVVTGKYGAYGKETYAEDIVVNQEVKLGERLSVYYKPDDPKAMYLPTNYNIYIILIAAVAVLDIVFIILSRLINKSLKDNTFSDAAVTIMDIPIIVFVVAVILAFFAGMLIGNIQIGAEYSNISQGLAEMYANHELSY